MNIPLFDEDDEEFEFIEQILEDYAENEYDVEITITISKNWYSNECP